MCGRIFAATDACTALSATRGTTACAAKFKYVASSIGNHSFFQSIERFSVIFSSVCSGSKGDYPKVYAIGSPAEIPQKKNPSMQHLSTLAVNAGSFTRQMRGSAFMKCGIGWEKFRPAIDIGMACVRRQVVVPGADGRCIVDLQMGGIPKAA
jgi:hypothetical protein